MLNTDLATIPNSEGVLPAILCRKETGKIQHGLHLPYMPERSIGGVPPFAHVFILTSLGSLKRKKIIPIDPINQAVDRGFCRSDIRPPRREKPNKSFLIHPNPIGRPDPFQSLTDVIPMDTLSFFQEFSWPSEQTNPWKPLAQRVNSIQEKFFNRPNFTELHIYNNLYRLHIVFLNILL